jgi:hypothetical protein
MSSKHPRIPAGSAGGGRFAGAGFTAAGRDPKALAAAAAHAAALGLGGSRTLAREAKLRARAAGAGLAPQKPELKYRTEARAEWAAREAVRRQVGGPYKKRPEQAGEIQRRFGAGRARKEPPQAAAAAAAVKPAAGGEKPPEPAKPAATPAESHLMTAEIDRLELMSGSKKGINDSYWTYFKDGSRGVWKPTAEPTTNSGPTRRTPASISRTAWTRSVRWPPGRSPSSSTWEDMVPPTVIRNVQAGAGIPANALGPGSMQDFVKNSDRALDTTKPRFDGAEDHARAAIFDYVMGHEDRHEGNWMMDKTTGKLTLIDHGLILPESTGLYCVRGPLAAGSYLASGSKSPSEYAELFNRYRGPILNTLSDLHFSEHVRTGVSRRINALMNMKKTEDWRTIANKAEGTEGRELEMKAMQQEAQAFARMILARRQRPGQPRFLGRP